MFGDLAIAKCVKNLPPPVVAASRFGPIIFSRRSRESMGLRNFFSSREIQCPLCGATESRPTNGFVSFDTLRAQLAKEDAWMSSHNSAGVPDLPAEVRTEVGTPSLPSVEEGPDGEHRRCAKCKSLLPPQFWQSGVAQPLAMTVTGNAGHGKTTWLLSLMAPPVSSRYAIIGFNERHLVQSYDYAEPYTLEVLDANFRSVVPFVLMGCTIHHTDGLVDVRTLDIMGEMFARKPEDVAQRVERHLAGRRGGGGLLVVERFSKDPKARTQQTIAKTYLRLATRIREKLHGRSTLWRGIVWTWLDEAKWTPAGEQWLRQNVKTAADTLIKIGSSAPANASTLLDDYDRIRDANDKCLVELLRAVHSKVAAPTDAVEALIALLFRLQILYAAYVGDRRLNRLEYFYGGVGQRFVTICQELAKQLYIRWDTTSAGGLSAILTGGTADDDWKVLPCARLTLPQMKPESVWSDQIVIEAIARANEMR
jgi:hypothetical protein